MYVLVGSDSDSGSICDGGSNVMHILFEPFEASHDCCFLRVT